MSNNKRWIWFFVILAILTAIATSIQIWFNASQQLTLEKLEAARGKWRSAQLLNYDLEYTKKGSVTGRYFVEVRSGKVVSATLDERPLERRLYTSCNIPALFDDIGRFLEMDAQAGIRPFTVATFDPRDGHLVHYVRSVNAQQRIEITVQLRALSDSASACPRKHEKTLENTQFSQRFAETCRKRPETRASGSKYYRPASPFPPGRV